MCLKKESTRLTVTSGLRSDLPNRFRRFRSNSCTKRQSDMTGAKLVQFQKIDIMLSDVTRNRAALAVKSLSAFDPTADMQFRRVRPWRLPRLLLRASVHSSDTNLFCSDPIRPLLVA